MSVHVIPVPEGMTPDDAWAEIAIMGALVEPVIAPVCWAVIEVDDA